MAEALSQLEQDSLQYPIQESQNQQESLDPSRRIIQVLMLATRWSFDTYGVSTINKSLVNNLRLVDPEAKSIKITCAVLDEEGSISIDQRRDAEKYGVQLKFAKQPQGKKKKPELSWINEYITSYYQHLILDTKYDFIFGHMPYLVYGCLNLKQHSINIHRDHTPKVILMVHDVPRNQEGHVDEELLSEWLQEADTVLSVGQAASEKVESHTRAHNIATELKLYLPTYPLELFTLERDTASGRPRGEQNIVMMAREMEDFEVADVDFELAVVSCAKSANEMRQKYNQIRFNFWLISGNQEEKSHWEQKFKEVKEKHGIEETFPIFRLLDIQDVEELKPLLKKTTIMISPLRTQSTLFTSETLVAIAAGVPILVSRDSGVATFLQNLGLDDPIVQDNEGFRKDSEEWKKRIIQTIEAPDRTEARKLKKQLLLDTSVAETHLEFVKIVTGSQCIHVKLEVTTDSVVGDGQRKIARDVGIDLGGDPINIKTYIIALLQNLLLQREKINQHLFDEILEPEIKSLYSDVLSALEETERHAVAFYHGSLVFTLYCPRQAAKEQLRDETWIKRLSQSLEKFLLALDVQVEVNVQIPDITSTTVKSLEVPSLPKRLEKRRKRTSEGYGTASSRSSSVSSSGSSDTKPRSDEKVRAWLQLLKDRLTGLVRMQEIHIDPIEPNILNKFAVSDSGIIAVASPEPKPSLFLFYPDPGRTPAMLSDEKSYYSPIFIKKPGEDMDYLAVHCKDEGTIHLWDIEKQKPETVYKLPAERRQIYMNLCVVDETTMAYGERESTAGIANIHMLKVESGVWSDWSTLKVKGGELISDMMSTQIDGTACLVLCYPEEGIVEAIEIAGGDSIWKKGKEELGEHFRPWSFCIDNSNILHIVDLQNTVHHVQCNDGTLLQSSDRSSDKMRSPYIIRTQGDFIYIGYKEKQGEKFTIAMINEDASKS